jgi:protein-disulfide isomerase
MNLSTKVRPLAISLLLFSGAFITSGWAQEEETSNLSKVVAEVQGVTITQEDLQSGAAEELEKWKMEALQFEAKQERAQHEILQRQLDALVAETLVALEAAEQGLSDEELLEKEVLSNFEEPTQEEVDAFYQTNQQRLQGSKPQLLPRIRQYLADQKREQIYQDFVDQLETKYGVITHFPPLRIEVATEGHPSHGSADAPVTIVEFSDFECPYCQGMLGTIKNVQEAYGEKVRLVYRQFPLNSIHPNAQKAAEASLCAKDQGKFWEMHDLMFEDQRGLSVEALTKKAVSLELDGSTFERCLTSNKYAEQVKQDVMDGTVVGVTGTPAIFINGRPLVGNVPYDQLAEIIDEELMALPTPAQ